MLDEAEERVDARKQLFLASASAGAGRNNYKAIQTPFSNMEKVLTLFQTQVEKDDCVNAAFAEDMCSAAEERRLKMSFQERAALNAEIKDWQTQQALSTDDSKKASFTALIAKNTAVPMNP